MTISNRKPMDLNPKKTHFGDTIEDFEAKTPPPQKWFKYLLLMPMKTNALKFQAENYKAAYLVALDRARLLAETNQGYVTEIQIHPVEPS
jgi:hypothetical protein